MITSKEIISEVVSETVLHEIYLDIGKQLMDSGQLKITSRLFMDKRHISGELIDAYTVFKNLKEYINYYKGVD